MATLIEDTQGKIRDLPIQKILKDLLIGAADVAGIDRVRVVSGGQAKLGTPGGKRTGSVRHDLGYAADLRLEKDGAAISFANPAGQAIFEAYVEACARLGATGIGAAVDYMGPLTIHVGYGARAVWGTGGKSANAPRWLIDAVRRGWAASTVAGMKSNKSDSLDSPDAEEEEDMVT